MTRAGRGQCKDIRGTLGGRQLNRARPWGPCMTAHITLSSSISCKEHVRGSKMCLSNPPPPTLASHFPQDFPIHRGLKTRLRTTNRLQREQLLANYLIRFHLQVNTCSLQLDHIQYALVNENKKISMFSQDPILTFKKYCNLGYVEE